MNYHTIAELCFHMLNFLISFAAKSYTKYQFFIINQTRDITSPRIINPNKNEKICNYVCNGCSVFNSSSK